MLTNADICVPMLVFGWIDVSFYLEIECQVDVHRRPMVGSAKFQIVGEERGFADLMAVAYQKFGCSSFKVL